MLNLRTHLLLLIRYSSGHKISLSLCSVKIQHRYRFSLFSAILS